MVLKSVGAARAVAGRYMGCEYWKEKDLQKDETWVSYGHGKCFFGCFWTMKVDIWDSVLCVRIGVQSIRDGVCTKESLLAQLL